MSKQTQKNPPGRPVMAVNTACTIIEGLRELGDAGVTELADYLDLSKSVVYNHLSTLQKNGFIIKDDTTYRLSFHFLNIGEEIRHDELLYQAAQKNVEKLAEESGEYAHLMVLEQGRGYYLHRAKGPKAVATTSRIGKWDYLHRTGAGKAILANLDREHVEDIIQTHGLPAQTENTITDLDRLFNELETIREDGVAVSNEECVKSARSIGAPIIGPAGEVLGAISISGPTTRVKDERLSHELSERIVKTANYVEMTINTQEQN